MTDEAGAILSHIRELQSNRCSADIADVHDMTLIREINVSLTGVDTVEQVPQTEVALYDRHKTDVSFILPIKVPAYDERHMDDGKHFTKSNLNVSFVFRPVFLTIGTRRCAPVRCGIYSRWESDPVRFSEPPVSSPWSTKGQRWCLSVGQRAGTP